MFPYQKICSCIAIGGITISGLNKEEFPKIGMEEPHGHHEMHNYYHPLAGDMAIVQSGSSLSFTSGLGKLLKETSNGSKIYYYRPNLTNAKLTLINGETREKIVIDLSKLE